MRPADTAGVTSVAVAYFYLWWSHTRISLQICNDIFDTHPCTISHLLDDVAGVNMHLIGLFRHMAILGASSFGYLLVNQYKDSYIIIFVSSMVWA